ncbi:MAG: YggS family pyridoxal phosphate-dependent enzyme [Sandaracinaceae bacterium]
MSPHGVAARLAAVRSRIAEACARAGRAPEDVVLVAVSKGHPAARIREAYAAGQRVFGENYVQDLVAKAEALGDLPDLAWHFIGHLQRNKAKHVARLGATVETVDRVRLAEALDRAVERAGAGPLPVLIQVNVGGEEQKSGCRPDDVAALAAAVRALPRLALQGLMTVPPLGEHPQHARPHFARLRALRDEAGLAALSMGMSADREVAVEEGATLVRVGTAIFGPRPGAGPTRGSGEHAG